MVFNGACHCKKVKFVLKSHLKNIAQCNCSYCKRRNSKMILEKKDAIKITEGLENLSLYQFNTNVAKHHFCKECGIFVYSNRRFDPEGIAVNSGCIDEIDIFKIESKFADNINK